VFDNGPKLAEFVTRELLPRLSSELPVSAEPASRGLDGVSLGGRAALVIGFTEAKAFGTLGAIQPALDEEELPRFAALAEAALRSNPALKLRLLTSHEDYYREVVNDFAALLRERGVRHRLELVSGDHSYEFNRGPGVIEMLLFHSRELHR
jgi:enterochelin esterase-like enzyme